MAQFDIHRNTGLNTAIIPYMVVVQSDLLDGLATRVVVPLVKRSEMRPASQLNPVFQIEGVEVVFSTAEIASLALGELTGEVVANAGDQRARMARALDFLFFGG